MLRRVLQPMHSCNRWSLTISFGERSRSFAKKKKEDFTGRLIKVSAKRKGTEGLRGVRNVANQQAYKDLAYKWFLEAYPESLSRQELAGKLQTHPKNVKEYILKPLLQEEKIFKWGHKTVPFERYMPNVKAPEYLEVTGEKPPVIPDVDGNTLLLNALPRLEKAPMNVNARDEPISTASAQEQEQEEEEELIPSSTWDEQYEEDDSEVEDSGTIYSDYVAADDRDKDENDADLEDDQIASDEDIDDEITVPVSSDDDDDEAFEDENDAMETNAKADGYHFREDSPDDDNVTEINDQTEKEESEDDDTALDITTASDSDATVQSKREEIDNDSDDSVTIDDLFSDDEVVENLLPEGSESKDRHPN